ncbi:cold-shock protein [Streptomyces sp. NPDC058579]|uniref:cold-shock protein n=1 Tax=Streptomyces sp. NPDC058579 TaxID=3346548 RepID=UPI003662CA8F
MVVATVREWYEEDGWGVLECAETPGGCWGHFSSIRAAGFRTLVVGQLVELEWEAPGFEQDGYGFRALKIVPLDR